MKKKCMCDKQEMKLSKCQPTNYILMKIKGVCKQCSVRFTVPGKDLGNGEVKNFIPGTLTLALVWYGNIPFLRVSPVV